NVSFYNETDGRSIPPTPTIAMVGLLDEVETHITSWWKGEGDLIVLLGRSREELGGSEYLAVLHGIERGIPPWIDLDAERRLQRLCLLATGARATAGRLAPCTKRVSSATVEAGGMFDKFHEECGVVGVYGHPEAATLAYLALYALQHRGQESAGIVASNGEALISHRGMGHVAEIFGQDVLARLEGRLAIGHNRYSTSGST